MNTMCNVTHENIDGAFSELLKLNVQRRESFLVPDKIGSFENSKIKDENYESTSSESNSAELPARAMSTTESTVGDESLSHQTDSNMQCNTAYSYQTPITQPMGNQMYQPIYNQQLQFQQSNNLPNGMPTLGYAPVNQQPMGYAPVQQQPMSMNLHLDHQVQRQQVLPQQIRTLHQYQQIPQIQLPVSGTAVPYMMGPVYPQQSNSQYYQMSPTVASSTTSTPVLSCFSTPGYSNVWGYINTPMLSSASGTPIQCNKIYPDIPPVLNLNNNLKNDGNDDYPRRISCNINTVPSSSECLKAEDTPSSDCAASSDALMKKSNLTANCFSFHQSAGKTGKSDVKRKEEKDVWLGSCNYAECWHEGGSNLYVTWSGSRGELVEKLHSFKLEVGGVFRTSDQNLWNVMFESHPTARKAFTMQHLIRLRMVPPKTTNRIWFRNPSPKFLVQYETKRRLVVRKGRAECHDIVGELLKGCLITADQLKGHRIRVVCCEGSFMFPGGKIVEMKGVLNESSEKTSLGWVSHRCKYTKESLVIRRSWNMLSDYIYNE